MPEKNVNEVSRDVRELYQKGTAALQRQNFDYALAILNQVLQKEPGFFDCRQALRAAQFKKSGGSTSFFKKMLGGASSSPLIAKAQMSLRKNPLEAIQTAEQILNSDPANSAAHKLLAEAALEADLPKTACLSYEILLKNNQKDFDLTFLYGKALAKSGQVAKAENLYSELLRANPHRQELAQALKDLSARNTMEEGGYEALADGSGSYRDILRNKEEAVSLEQEQKQVKSEDAADRLIRENQARLAQEPRNTKVLRSLGELFAQKKDYTSALHYAQQMKSADAGNDPSLDKWISDLNLRKFDQDLEQLDPAAADYADQQARIKAARAEFELSECKARAERYPTDLGIRFELGELYFQNGKLSEAIQEFQKAQNYPARRIAALTYLGQCFARRGVNDLAARTFQNALKEKPTFDDEKKDLIYELGNVLEKMGKREEAIEHFKQIYEVDIGYKDVAAKVDAYYSGGGT